MSMSISGRSVQNMAYHVVTNEEHHPIETFCIYCRASWDIPNLRRPISTNLN